MEVVLLWLDDLEDWIFASLSVWPRVRRLCLQLGLLSALSIPLADVSSEGALALSGVAAASVISWLLALWAPLLGGSARLDCADAA